MTGKAWQRQIRESFESGSDDLFGKWWEGLDNSLGAAEIRPINSEEAAAVILKYEWLGTMPLIVKECFGLFCDRHLAGALVFAENSGSNLSSGRIVPIDSHYLARGACVHWAHPHAASYFISKVCREFLCRDGGTVLAYSDPMAGEVGTIYQALGWYYLGQSCGRVTGYLVDGKRIAVRSFKRDRNYLVGQEADDVRAAFPRAKTIIPIWPKHRYLGVYGDRRYKKKMAKLLAPHSLPYPKRVVTHPPRAATPQGRS